MDSFVRRLRCTAAWAGLALTLAGSAQAAGFVRESYPLPQRVDRTGRVRTGLLLSFELERYGLTVAQFAARRRDAAETAFLDFTNGLLEGDVPRVATFRKGEAPAQTKALVTGYHQFFTKSPARMGIVARVAAGNHQVFVWDWPVPEGKRVLQAFAVEPLAGGGARVEIVTSDRPVDTLIVDVLQQHQFDAAAYAPVAPTRQREYAFPLAGGQPGAHPVRLHFDGLASDLELGTNEADAELKRLSGQAGDALRAYEGAWQDFKRGDLEAYLTAFTEGSAQKLRDAFAKMTAEELDAYRTQAGEARRVRFLLHAQPLALVFYTRGEERRVYYDYLIHDARRGYKLTNVGFEDFLDDALHDDRLWPTRLEAFRKDVLGLTNSK